MSKISIVMPYWKRQGELIRTLKSYHSCGYNHEVVLVDDGSGDDVPATIKLTRKDFAMNPCVPINKGVKAAKGEIIVITGPELVHRVPILDEMKKSLESLGRKGYVIAAAWSVGQVEWHCHSTVNGHRPGSWPVPKGSGFHFCTMMYRDFFLEIGGFDESYREGSAFDDNDFLWTLEKNGAVFCMRDDLVVDHYQTSTKWPAGGWEKNRLLFEDKWADYINSRETN